MLYHASPISGIKTLVPHISNHGIPLVYLSDKRENVLVYLSNAVEKCCNELGYKHSGIYRKWGSYGFTKNGLLQLDEYWPNATADTYKGVKGFIYHVEGSDSFQKLNGIPNAFTCADPVAVSGCELVPDAYEALLLAEKAGLIVLTQYSGNSEAKLDWIKNTVINEYRQSEDKPEYRFFWKANSGLSLKIKVTVENYSFNFPPGSLFY